MHSILWTVLVILHLPPQFETGIFDLFARPTTPKRTPKPTTTMTPIPEIDVTLEDLNLLNALCDGNISNLSQNATIEKVLYNLKYLQKVPLSHMRKVAILRFVTRKKMITEDLSAFMQLGTMFFEVFDAKTLETLDGRNWELLEYLGTLHLDRRFLGIIAANLKRKFGPIIITSYVYINQLRSLICGFPVADLKEISDENFLLIKDEVFASLWGCTKMQLDVLLSIAMRSTVYGRPQGWGKNVVKTLGLLIAILPKQHIDQMNPLAFEGIYPGALIYLGRKVATELHISNKQLASFPATTLAEYRRIVGIASRANAQFISPYVVVLAFFVKVITL